MSTESAAKVSVPWRMPSEVVQMVRDDAKKHSKSMDDLGTFIVRDFFSAWTDEERAKIYERLPKKVFGAPCKKTRRNKR